MNMGKIMSLGFEKTILMQNNLNLQFSELISTYVYNVGLGAAYVSDFSLAAAVDLFNAVVNLILIIISNIIAKRISGTSWW